MKGYARPDRTHNPFDETHWVSRLRENLTSGSYGEGLETGRRRALTGHEGGNPGYRQGQSCYALPRQSFTRQLVIKRLKSLLDLDRLRAREDSLLAELYLHGKLLYAWVVEQRARRRCGVEWMRTHCPRQATWWRVWKVIHQELGMLIRDVAHWRFERWAQCLAVMQERPRKRQLQTLPSRVKQLLVICQACGLSHYAPMAA